MNEPLIAVIGGQGEETEPSWAVDITHPDLLASDQATCNQCIEAADLNKVWMLLVPMPDQPLASKWRSPVSGFS